MERKTCARFVVDEKPYCLWDIDIPARNRELLQKIDPEYFRHLADINFDLLDKSQDKDNPSRQHAAISLRIAYSHALEVLFSLIGATIQAPDCVVGWLIKYRPGDIPKIVKKVTNNQPLLSNFDPTPRGWREVAEVVFSPASGTEQYDFLIEKFSGLWERFAYEFLDSDFQDEYNSAKHGFRAKAAGFFLVIDDTNSPTLTGNPVVHANSEFGMSYFKDEKIDNLNFIIHHQGNNWHPLNYAYALDLISTSLTNIIAFLSVTNGIDFKELSVSYPDDPAYFDKPWEIEQTGAFKITQSSQVNVDKVPRLSKEQIRSRYPNQNS